jgi:parvulin-like peptidyl-prolyl isomerase
MKRIVSVFAMFVLLTGATFAQSDLQPIANVKLLKSEPVTIKQLKSRVEAYQKEMGRVMTLDERKKVLDSIVNERLVVQAAERDGIKVTDAEVTQNFNVMISQQFGKQITEVELAQVLKKETGLSLDEYMRAQNGMSLAEYKNFLKSQLLAQRYVISKKQADLQNMVGPTDADIRSYYELYKQKFVQTDTVKMFLVVVPKTDNPTAQAKINDLRKQLVDNPGSANELKVRSQAANSGFQAGDMYVNKSANAAQQLGVSMDVLLKVFSMDLNEVSDVAEYAKDYQFYKIMEKFPAKILSLSDLVQPGTTVTVYEYIKSNLTSQAQQMAVNQALVDIINGLRTGDNFQILKSGADLDKALSW